METKKITIDEANLKPENFNSMIVEFIEALINNYKIQSLREWERNHNSSDSEWRKRITELTNLKNNLKEQYKSSLNKDVLFDLKLSFEMYFLTMI